MFLNNRKSEHDEDSDNRHDVGSDQVADKETSNQSILNCDACGHVIESHKPYVTMGGYKFHGCCLYCSKCRKCLFREPFEVVISSELVIVSTDNRISTLDEMNGNSAEVHLDHKPKMELHLGETFIFSGTITSEDDVKILHACEVTPV